MQKTGVALQRTGGALQRIGDPPDRTGGAIKRSRHVLTLEPATAHAAGPVIAPKEHLHPTGMMFARTCVRTYVTLENIVHSISLGRTITKC